MPPGAEACLQPVHIEPIEVEEHRCIHIPEGLSSQLEGSVTDQEEAIGLRLLQIPPQEKTQIAAAPVDGQVSVGEGGQKPEGVAMGVHHQVKGLLKRQRHDPPQLNRFRRTRSTERQIEL